MLENDDNNDIKEHFSKFTLHLEYENKNALTVHF